VKPVDEISCPVCHGEPELLGQLGKLVWYRCQDCGTNFSERETA
jgi:transposase-like protein